MPERINIFEYTDFKKYLRDWRTREKKNNPGLSHQYLCGKLGQNNRSYFNDIEMGRKNIGDEVLDRLIELLCLKGQEKEYFTAMVNYGQTGSYQKKESSFNIMISLNNTPKALIDKATFQYFNEWYHSCIRSLLDVIDFVDDFKMLAQKLFNRISIKQAKDSITLLSKLGMIKNENGFWKPTDKILTTGDNVRHECLQRYQLANHDIIRKILEDDVPGTHDSSEITLSVSKQGLERVIRKIKQIRSEIMSIAHKDEEKSDRVYRVVIHAYPISRKE